MKTLLAILVAVMMLGFAGIAHADDACADPTVGATVDVDFSVTKEGEICLQLGSSGTIDTLSVTFDIPTGLLADFDTDLPINIDASVDAAATVSLTADSSALFTSGTDTFSGASIVRAFTTGTEISIDTYYDGSTDQSLWTNTGSGTYSDTISHQIRLLESTFASLPPGTYTARYSYTLVSDR